VVRSGQFWIARPQAPAGGLGDLVLSLKSPLLLQRGRWPGISWQGTIKLPTGRFEHLTGSGGTDAQIALFISQPVGQRFAVHYNAAYTAIGQPARHIGFPVRAAISHLLAIEYLATRRVSVITQALANTSLFPSSRLGPLDRTAYELNAGISYALSRSSRFEIGFIENLSQYQNTPDIALHCGISVTR
jgi:hypothetical protein